MECTCQKEFFDSSSSGGIGSSILSIAENFETSGDAYVIDFGQIPVGKEAIRVLKLMNDSNDRKVIRIQRHPRTNPIYHCFQMDTYEKVVPPNRSFNLTITHCCTIPHRINREFFNIISGKKLIYNVTLIAESVGPIINASATCLYFYECVKVKQKKNILELRNTSKVDVEFQFDVNEGQQDTFIVKPIRGNIRANKYVYVHIVYSPNKPGHHYARLPCLIEHHEAIIIEAIGVYSFQEYMYPTKLNVVRYAQPLEELVGFSGYLSDSLKMRTYIPPVSLSEHILNFGRLLPVEAYNRMCTVNNCLTLVTSLTNHTDNQIEIVWQKDCDNVFSISPERVVVPKKESVLFECHFYPNFQDQLYFKILTAEIIWTQTGPELMDTNFFVPHLISLRLLGHSFPENKEWIPRVDVPVNVILPSTLPQYPTYNTFLIQSKGHLPVLFKFIPPKNSVFVVKPIAGIIRKYQIIVVQMQTVATENSAYIEQWQLELNGQKDRTLQMYFKGQTEYPSVSVENNNFIDFGCIHPGCQGIRHVFFRNDVSYPLRYKFDLDTHPYLTISNPGGVLHSNEDVQLSWYLLINVQIPPKFNVKCEIRAIQHLTETIGPPFERIVTITSERSFSQLCATPNAHSFGSVNFGSSVETSFTMFNFGCSPLHVALFCEMPKELKRSSVHISPVNASVGNREKCKVEIKLNTQDLGFHRIKICYHIKINEISEKIIKDKNPIEIFSMDFESAWPTVQITEILDYNFGPLFSKANLWELLNIKEINRVFQNIENCENKTVVITVPDMEVQNLLHKTVMLVSNFSKLEEKIVIRKQQNCECKAVAVPLGMTRRKKVFNCNHRLMSNLYLDNEIITANSSAILTLEVNYILPGSTQSIYLLTLSHDRTIKLIIDIRSIPKRIDSMLPCKYSRHYVLDFKKVFLGEKDPMAKGFWFYNNSEIATKYEVAVKLLEELNREGEATLRCLNPFGMIDSHWALPLIFQFIPNGTKPIEISLPVYFEKQVLLITIKAAGSTFYKPVIKKLGTQKIRSVIPSLSFVISPQHINIPFTTVWNHVEKLIFVTNQTQNRKYRFIFQMALVEGIVKIEAWPAAGCLQPGQTQAVTLKITSFDAPCDIQLNVSCKFLDETQKAQHEASLQTYYTQKRSADMYEYPEKPSSSSRTLSPIQIVPEPHFVYQTISVHVKILSMCDRDLYLDVVQQKLLSPQLDIRLNNSAICKCLKYGSDKAIYKQLHEKISVTHIRTFENTIYHILRDAVHSVFFTNVVDMMNSSPPAYYCQLKYTVEHSKPRSSVNLQEYIRKCTNESETVRRHMMEQFLRRPRSYILAKVFQQLIFESVCDVFKLKVSDDL